MQILLAGATIWQNMIMCKLTNGLFFFFATNKWTTQVSEIKAVYQSFKICQHYILELSNAHTFTPQ
jgi:hypothetical protein